MRILKISVLIIFLMISLSDIKSQSDFTCGFNDFPSNSTTLASPFVGANKPVRTDLSGDDPAPEAAYFPVLVVFVEFADDGSTEGWTAGQAPSYMNTYISPIKRPNTNWWDAYNENTEQLSDMWMEMSRGKLHVAGSAYYVRLDNNRSSYTNEYSMNDEIWTKIKAQGLTDWRPYDKWTKNTTDGKFYYTPDHRVDMIYKIHKTYAPCMDSHGGYNQLGSQYSSEHLVDAANQIYVNPGRSELGSGLTLSFGGNKEEYIATIGHEHSHYLYAEGHITYGRVSFGMGFDAFYSPYEMIANNYMSPTLCTFNTSHTLGDYSSRNNGNGEILKVPIQAEEYYLIANRRKVSKWDRVMTGDTAKKGCYSENSDYAKGLYIYHVKDGILYPTNNTNNVVQDLESADGFWEWQYGGMATQRISSTCFQSAPDVWPYFKKKQPLYINDNTALSKPTPIGDLLSFHYAYNVGTVGDLNHWWGFGKEVTNACDIPTDRMYTNSDEVQSGHYNEGNRKDAWALGYNVVFSPYSSPNTKSWNDNNTGIFIYYSGLSGNNAGINIYKVGENGMTENQILEVTPPSRPMLYDLQAYTDGLYCHPQIIWRQNTEPDMIRNLGDSKAPNYYKRYKIYRSMAANLGVVPPDQQYYPENKYSLVATVDINSSLPDGSWIDNTVNMYSCSYHTLNPGQYPVRYRVQAVDVYNSSSVLSDFRSVKAVTEEQGGDAIGGNENGLERTGAENPEVIVPQKYNLYQNYPNPFNPVTNIQYDLPKDNFISIKIYDLLGKEVADLVNDYKAAGSYLISFDGSKLASGIYFYKIQTNDFVQTKRMLIVK